DHPIVRSGLEALLSGGEDIEPVGQAADGVAALEAVRDLRPDVVLMDLGLPRLSGVEAIRRLTAQSGCPRILVLTMSDDDASRAAGAGAGAHGYLLKAAGADGVLAAVRAVARGEAVFGRGVAPNILDLLRGHPRPAPPPFPELTARERAVLDLVARG